VFGYPVSDFFKKPLLWYELIIPEDKPIADAGFPVLESGKSHRHEVRIKRGDGEIRWIEAKMKPTLNNDGKLIQVDGIVSDITHRKLAEEEIIKKNEEYYALNEELSESIGRIQKINVQLEQAKIKAEESDRLKSSFLQNMSHEIRTPLNAIMGFSDLLPGYFHDKEKITKFTGIIKQRGSDLLEIINDILDIAKIESGQLTVYEEEFNLNELFDEIEIYFNEHRIRNKKADIDFKFNVNCKNFPIKVIIDGGKLKQIISNLLTNAFKFTKSGKVEIGCNLIEQNLLSFYVSDTGIGIPIEKQSTIFERFIQANPETTRLYGGTGLGLSIAKGLLNLLGGKIWVESELGKGSTFHFTFPFKLGNNKTIKADLESVGNDLLNTDGITILLVEDDNYNTQYLREILSETNHTIINTEYGKQAIEIALKQNIDLILMDIRLPDITGYEAIRLIKQQKPEQKIIAQTAYASPSDKQKTLDAGCDGFISKPISKIALFDLLKQIIHRQ
jgi:signal transduction histidine kinase